MTTGTPGLYMGIINDSNNPIPADSFLPLKTWNSLKGMDIQKNYAVLNGNSEQ